MNDNSSQSKPVEIIGSRCTGCSLCVKACPFGAISMRDRKAVIDYDACTFCGACVSICRPAQAIVMNQDSEPPRRSRAGDVWVYGEVDGSGKLSPPTAELLGQACKLAGDLDTGVAAILIGDNLSAAARAAAAFGAQTVYCADAPYLKHFRDEPYADLLVEAVRTYQPEILLGPATTAGRAVLPRAAVLLHTGLTADCTELSIDPKTGCLLQTRPAFGGNIMATIQCAEHRPQMATVRPGVLSRPDKKSGAKARRVPLEVDTDRLQSGIRWLDSRETGEGTGSLQDASIIVAAGAGAGGVDGVKLVEQLARSLGGVLGASRSVVDAGWVTFGHQIGQTGTTVQPDLYIACGISGAIQHIVGMQNSRRIIAINSDPEAPIFNYADVGIVGTIFEIIPALLRKLEAEKMTPKQEDNHAQP